MPAWGSRALVLAGRSPLYSAALILRATSFPTATAYASTGLLLFIFNPITLTRGCVAQCLGSAADYWPRMPSRGTARNHARNCLAVLNAFYRTVATAPALATCPLLRNHHAPNAPDTDIQRTGVDLARACNALTPLALCNSGQRTRRAKPR